MTAVLPRLVIAAPASGSGKTTVATGLMAALTAAGLAVSPHKVGPDYIDPGYHALATGRPGRNLDAYLCGAELVGPLFRHGAQGCDVAVVEGVMGLYDGASGQGEVGSTAQVAKLLRAPVVLVVDAARQSRSVAALVHGFASFDPEVRIGGVVLNNVGSAHHETLLRDALAESGVPVLGALPRTPDLHVPSRHLGLVPAAERRAEALAWIRAAGERVRESCDLQALLALAHSAPPVPDEAWDAGAAVRGAALSEDTDRGQRAEDGRDGPRTQGVDNAAPAAGPTPRTERPLLAVAGGAAFTFGYPENRELLEAAGAECVPFDPLADEALPEGTAGIVIGGGFPEAYAPALSANAALRREIAAFTGPVAAECAGLLYLTRALDGSPMCGVLDATAEMTDRLTLGYREAVALGDSVLARAGTRLRGHEFHRTEVRPTAAHEPAWGFTHPRRRTEGVVSGQVHASYLHVHWAAEPALAGRLVAQARRTSPVERCAV
ncbi:cobyrinate a,c-diamide synthase [Actinacidiphila acididurans]|uniref:Hydrogenobyrinate a,c-diamide synthase n=1 Tax=Actinacidiphila acididurans TaxID=2784346 RepID=A0ABS2TQQ1_9ACTN|nr:cobyrinate a,c-diamide synthase [Actinacidiphila acididurans]MBM9505659.1 cobyrinate a,c-diamide synthase [Actinacidiphila acididurans]